jgi:hypothetical protein
VKEGGNKAQGSRREISNKEQGILNEEGGMAELGFGEM